jgi:hypothetical protein
MREIWLSDARLELLPDDLAFGLSEVFLPFVDELITVSSNLAMSAFLLGKRVTAIGTSFARTLERLVTETDDLTKSTLRAKMLRYIEERMSVDDTTFTDPALLRNRMAKLLRQYRDNRNEFSHLTLPDGDYPFALTTPQDEWVDLRCDDPEQIHTKIQHCLNGSCPSALLPIFGRHALGYMANPESVGAEFGVARGYFSESLLRSRRFRTLYSIDKWDDHHDDAEFTFVQERLAQFGECSKIIRRSFIEALSEIADDSLDFLYVDGYAHTGHDADIVRLCLNKLKNRAVVAVHDFDRFSWPTNYEKLGVLFREEFFNDVEHIPGVLTVNNEDIFSGAVAVFVRQGQV